MERTVVVRVGVRKCNATSVKVKLEVKCGSNNPQLDS